MAEQGVVQLVMLLYDVCKDVFIHFFKTRCLNGSLTDMALQAYLKEHNDRLNNHFSNSYCHLCKDGDTCMDLSTKALFCFFPKTEGSILIPTDRDETHLMTERDLQVWNLQYLLLAGDLNNKEHKLIVGLYNMRKSVSKRLVLHLRTDKDQFSEIWDTSKKYIMDIYRSSTGTTEESMLCSRIEYLKNSDPKDPYEKDIWYNIQIEFGNKVRLNTILLSIGKQM